MTNYCDHDGGVSLDPAWRRAIWIALLANLTMFIVEIVVGVSAGSSALLADSLDFFADTAAATISLFVAGMAFKWRTRAAFLKGAVMLVLAMVVIGNTVIHVLKGTIPEAHAMGVIGILALITNLGVALILWRFRGGDSNTRSLWICSRNDALGNIAVFAAAVGVFGTGTGYPDYVVATIMALLGTQGGWQILREASSEYKYSH